MKLQCSYIKEGLIWNMEYDKENLETQETWIGIAEIYILTLGDQHIFSIILTCDWGVEAGSWNNFISFRREDWGDGDRHKPRRLGSRNDAMLWTPGLTYKKTEAWTKKKSTEWLSNLDGTHSFIQGMVCRIIPDHRGLLDCSTYFSYFG